MIKRYQKLRGSEATDRPRSSWNGMQFFDRQAWFLSLRPVTSSCPARDFCQVLAYFDSQPFRGMLKDCCPKIADLPAEDSR